MNTDSRMVRARTGVAPLVVLLCAFTLAGCGRRPEGYGYPQAKWFSRTAQGGFEEGRQGRKLDLVILYTTEHAAEKASRLWRESESLSGHYIVTMEGEVWQFLRDADTGWHAGNREYNLRSIAVAVEGFADPTNSENPSKDTSWQTEEEFESLANLMKWLCQRHAIPIDRAHIIGKNQVPGVKTEAFPESGPQYWGGASNKSSPGAFWNWGRLMEKLGRPPVYRSLSVLTNCPITTLPETNAPVITVASVGKGLRAYDSHNGYWLVLVTNQSVPQPYLLSGRYHWDG
jgi:N-acetyl-anhydromuramyl-L-alanine amidase AmpD